MCLCTGRCVLTAVSAGGGGRQTTICTDCSASLAQPTCLPQADLKGKWQWRGGKCKWDKEKKKLRRKAILAVEADSLGTRIFTQERCLAGSYLLPSWKNPVMCDTKVSWGLHLLKSPVPSHWKDAYNHPISGPAMLPDPHVIFHHHLSSLLLPPACSIPSQVPKVVGGKGKACIYQAGSQTEEINCEFVPGPLRENLAEITG